MLVVLKYYFNYPELIRPVRLTRQYFGDQIEDEMGGACGTHGRQERCIQGFGGET